MQQKEEQKQQQSKKISDLPKRPQRSDNLQKFTRKIDLKSNHFKINITREKINVYSIKILPEIAEDARQLREKIMRAARQDIYNAGLKPCYVQGLNAWSPIKIELPVTCEVILVEEGLKYAIKLTHVREQSTEDIIGSKDTKDIQSVVQFCNVRVKKALYDLNYVEIGRNSKFYNPSYINENRIQNQGIKVWRGYKTSMYLFESQPYLLIDFSSRVLRETTALSIIDDLFRKYRNRQDVNSQMKGLSIIANYGNYRIYRVEEIKFDLTPESRFKHVKSGREISYLDYFKDVYNITIRDRKQPLLLHIDKRNPDKQIYLIPELMHMTGLTDEQRSDFRLMKDVAQFTKLTAQERNEEVMTLQTQLKTELKKNNIILESDQTVGGFQILPPKIRLGNKELLNDTGFFILKDAVLKPGYIKDWFLVYQSRGKQDDDDADFLVDELKKNASKLGIKLEKPYFIIPKSTNPDDWCDSIDREIRKSGSPQMIVTFIPEKFKAQLYPALKDYCFQEVGISHQNILLKFLKNKNPGSVASKIVQQMNVKLGMPIWSIPRPPQVSDKTMLIGIDIYHKLISGQKSCMGIVASLDSEFTQYFSRVIIMKKGDLLTEKLTSVIEQAIMAYFDANGKKYFPDNIVIYRDGVGEGQIQTLVETEVTQVQSAISKISENYKPNLVFIMINKKINHRFFAVGGGDQGGRSQSRGAKGGPRNQLVNPSTGTIVADKIVNNYFDFFLCAQYVTEGTCTPTRFVVLYNNTNWNEETFWMLTYYQCFNYMNWSGAVRVPACVQYAHKLAFLVGDTFQNQIHQNLERLLCFL